MNLGLDISTSVIGICIFDDANFVLMDKINLSKIKNIFEKARETERVLDNIFKNYNIENVYIEDILLAFRRGMSSSKTLMQLARFNGIVSNIVYRSCGLMPVYINVNTARKLLGIKIDKNSSIDKKRQVLNWVDNDLGGYKWEEKVISRGKNKGCVKLENFCYDMSDSYVICKAGIKINNGHNK
tara:strand:+ start:16840 stop:17391 length:552 start_codon:yes stop_codon:yes gene_type:complete